MQRRASAVESFRSRTASHDERQLDSNVQLLAEIRRMGQDERSTIVKEAGLSVEISSEQGVAMKTDLGLPWNKIRHLRR